MQRIREVWLDVAAGKSRAEEPDDYVVKTTNLGRAPLGRGRYRLVVVVVLVVFDGVGGLHSSPQPEPPMGHMAVLG